MKVLCCVLLALSMSGCAFIPSDEPKGSYENLAWYEYNRNYGWDTGRKPIWVNVGLGAAYAVAIPVIYTRQGIDAIEEWCSSDKDKDK